ncbi:MAG: hypothetical protein U0R49_04760 [Fimbriimonadales bacterium]
MRAARPWNLELMLVMCGCRDIGAGIVRYGFTLIPGFAVTKRGTPEPDLTPATRRTSAYGNLYTSFTVRFAPITKN